jgi:phosphoribosylformimino-5-aminoimidazole carboxamide ribotide isomerase
MIAVPAVDLREGRCVQLVGGRPEEERVSLPDPVAQALRWKEMGFGTLHVVDLDAALSLGDNREVIREIVSATDAIVQVGGGIREESQVEALMQDGVTRVIIGTRAIDEADWLEDLARRYPGAIVVAADIRDGVVLRKGWTEASQVRILDLLSSLAPLPLAGVLCTDVAREGRMEGMDLKGAADIINGSEHPLWMSGGITTMDELRGLAKAGAAGAILGMAIYTGILPPDQVAKEFGA